MLLYLCPARDGDAERLHGAQAPGADAPYSISILGAARMKRLSMGMAMVIFMAALASAQANPGQSNNGPMAPQGPNGQPYYMMRTEAKAVHLEGKLAFENDHPVLQTKDGNYYLAIPRFYYYAYTEGFKAGDSFAIDGYLMTPPPAPAAQTQSGQTNQAQPAQSGLPVVRVTKLVVGSKTFDFSASFGRGMGLGMGMEKDPKLAVSGKGKKR